MSLRIFIDPAGHEWQAFDVTPRERERRNYDRRIATEVSRADDRRNADRRITVGGTAGIAGSQGWLCFERGAEHRRLTPIPSDWTKVDDERLAEYRDAARLVPRVPSVRTNADRKY